MVYLLKPILFERFLQAIDKFLATVTHQTAQRNESTTQLYVRSNRKNIKVVLEDILYVESLKDYIRIHLSERTIVVKQGLTAFAESLDQRFIRVHRSFIVNRDRVTAFTRQDIEIGPLEIPIGESYREEVLRRLQ